MTRSVVIQILRADESFLGDIRAFHPNALRVLETKELGGGDYLNLLIGLSLSTLPFITKLLVELIRARKHVSVKVDGIELSGLSEKNAKELLERLLKASNEQASRMD